MEEQGSNWFSVVLIVIVIWLAFFHQQKYEGQTAEEWFDEYDATSSEYSDFRNCVEEYAYSDDYEELQNIYYQCF